jgi:N,N'-diacetyllegionaminate synthase
MTDTKCFIIAEIGMNHNGKLDLARKSIEAAADAGCSAVKFQNFRTEDFIQDTSLTYTYESQGQEITEPFFELCKRNEFKKEWLPELRDLSEKAGMAFLSTPSSQEGIDDLAQAGCKYVKNGADALTHLPLLRAMAESGMHVIISTGMAYEQDIDSALEALAPALPDNVTLLHCTSNYPTKSEDTNLLRMISLRERYKLPTGFSDHTHGWQAAVQAVTLGAVMIEKHFTVSHDLAGPDHWFSSTPAEMKELVDQVRKAEICMGRPDIRPADGEMPVRDEFRLGLVAADDLKAGAKLSEDMVAFRKPAKGLLPRDLADYLGRFLVVDIKKDAPIHAGDFRT